jgi:hypothetical protein
MKIPSCRLVTMKARGPVPSMGQEMLNRVQDKFVLLRAQPPAPGDPQLLTTFYLALPANPRVSPSPAKSGSRWS